MSHIVVRGNVWHNGKVYAKGAELNGLRNDEAARLIAFGSIAAHEQDDSGHGPDETDTDDVLSAEEFEALSSADQKDELHSRGIEPGSNKEERIKQYTEWLSNVPV